MAERQGFEPWEGINPQRFSRPPHSTTLPPLLIEHSHVEGWSGSITDFPVLFPLLTVNMVKSVT